MKKGEERSQILGFTGLQDPRSLLEEATLYLSRVFPELLRAEASHRQDCWSGDEFELDVRRNGILRTRAEGMEFKGRQL